ncbi:COG1361 S-layer family protein [Halocatena pleomorpha]|nr:NEW3 domain-containing protein [Halocatena pleomorpha]
MNHSALAVSLVGLLVFHGIAVGFIVGDSAVGNVANGAETTAGEFTETFSDSDTAASVAASSVFETSEQIIATPPSPDAEFEVVSVSSDVPAGGIGNVSVTIENTGEDATNAVVSLQSLSGDFSFGQSPNTSRFVGEWNVGEVRTIEVQARMSRTADTTEYPVRATITYEDSGGNSSRSSPLTFGVAPDGEQRFSLSGVDGDLQAGESGTISGTITNEGPQSATDAVLTFGSNGNHDVIPRQSQYVLGSLDSDESESFELPVAVNSTAEPGQRQVPLVVEYYDQNMNPVQSQELTAQIDIDDERDDFEVVSSSTELQVGSTGIVSVTLENADADASEATVNLRSLSSGITFGHTANATQFVGEWDEGEERTITLNATASNQTNARSYPFQATVSYDDADGDQTRAGPFIVGVTPQPKQSFIVTNTSSTLRVGDEGTVTTVVTNQGPQNVSNAVVSLVTHSQNSNPQETEVAIGSLSVGESTTVSVPVETTDSAEPGQRQFSFVVEYDDESGNAGQSETLDTQVAVAPQRDEFIVERVNATIDVGSTGTVTLNVTNNRDTVVRNINAKTFVDDPLSTSTSDAYIARLQPGESAQIAFDVSVNADASDGQYPLSIDFEYETASDDSKLSQTYEIPVTATTEGDDGILPVLGVTVGLGALFALLGAGWVRMKQ